jgi:hypothetical protein
MKKKAYASGNFRVGKVGTTTEKDDLRGSRIQPFRIAASRKKYIAKARYCLHLIYPSHFEAA